MRHPRHVLWVQVVPHAFVGTKEMVALHGKQTVRQLGVFHTHAACSILFCGTQAGMRSWSGLQPACFDAKACATAVLACLA